MTDLALVQPLLAGVGLPSRAPDFGGLTGHRITIGLLFETHALFAFLVSGATQLGPILEWVGYLKQDQRYDRLARGISKFLVYFFAVGAFFAIAVVTFALTGLFGKAWQSINRVTFWAFYVEGWSFAMMVIAAYIWHYSWDHLRAYKRLHIAIGGQLAIASFLQVTMIDVVASYMLTPNNPAQPIRVFLNPTLYPLQVHRTVGNLAYVAWAVGAYGAIRFLRSRQLEERAYWDWVGSLGMLIGTGMSLLQPIVGYSYAKEIQLHAYGAWYKMMEGTLSPEFLGQITLLGMIFLVPAIYFAVRLRRDRAPGSFVLKVTAFALLLDTLFAAIPSHLAFTFDQVQAAGLDRPFWQGGLVVPFAAMIPYKVTALVFMTLLPWFAIIWYLRGARRIAWGSAGRLEQGLCMVSLVLVATMIMLMGFIRENSRYPDIVAGHITIQGQTYIDQPPSAFPAGPP
ncbi:MAG: cytochrome ubiquinol oxidase subunit I [Candidatus Dormibacterales bacterium]